MKVYLVCSNIDFDDPYEGRHSTFIDSVWSTLEKAQKQIALLKDKRLKELAEQCCGKDCPEPCSDHRCCYGNVDDANPNEIIIDELYGWSTTFKIIERRMDIPFGEEA